MVNLSKHGGGRRDKRRGVVYVRVVNVDGGKVRVRGELI